MTPMSEWSSPMATKRPELRAQYLIPSQWLIGITWNEHTGMWQVNDFTKRPTVSTEPIYTEEEAKAVAVAMWRMR